VDSVHLRSALALLLVLAGALASAAGGPALARILPFDRRLVLGVLGAIAAGVMLGAAYLVMAASVDAAPAAALPAAILTVLVIATVHRAICAAGPPDARLRRMARLHGVPEGLALGAAFATRLPLGLWIGVAAALHNAAEGALAGARADEARAGPTSDHQRASRALVDELPQAACAVGAWIAATTAPVTSGPLFGTAFAGLVYLVIAELLPEAYRRIGRVGVALSVMAAGTVVAALVGS
jgi:hypothetical protein